MYSVKVPAAQPGDRLSAVADRALSLTANEALVASVLKHENCLPAAVARLQVGLFPPTSPPSLSLTHTHTHLPVSHCLSLSLTVSLSLETSASLTFCPPGAGTPARPRRGP